MLTSDQLMCVLLDGQYVGVCQRDGDAEAFAQLAEERFPDSQLEIIPQRQLDERRKRARHFQVFIEQMCDRAEATR